jgi:hypothetical protein
MSGWLRRIRGAIGMGITWGVAWLGAGLVLLLIVGPNAADVPFPLFFGFLGFLAGLLFSGVLGLVERRRRFEEMSLPRFAGWGAAGGFLLSVAMSALLGWGAFPALGPLLAVSGAACAAGSLALARKAEGGESLGPGATVGELERGRAGRE